MATHSTQVYVHTCTSCGSPLGWSATPQPTDANWQCYSCFHSACTLAERIGAIQHPRPRDLVAATPPMQNVAKANAFRRALNRVIVALGL